jgi:putative SOS response-associated peptidase YedK
MCGRYSQTSPAYVLARVFCVPAGPPLSPRYNVAPTQTVPIVRQSADRELAMVRWGLIPPWADDPSVGGRLINARAETVAEKPAFRAAFRKRRCLVPATGFYEWQKLGKHKQPYHLRRRDGEPEPFAFAGLWERWQLPGDEPIDSCTILTTTANDLMRPLHERMPVILDPRGYDHWLDHGRHDREALRALLVPCPSELLTALPVNSYVNNPRNEGPKCLEPVPA